MPKREYAGWGNTLIASEELRMSTATSLMAPLSGAAVGRQKNQVDASTYSGRLAIRIRELRETAELDVSTVAKRMTRAGYRVSASTLYSWENGSRQPQFDGLPYVARAIGVPLQDLFPSK